MKTEAAVLTRLGQPLEILDLEIPKLKAGQVLVDVSYSGLCRSQILEINGKKGPDPFLPHTLGHEGSGVVLETGPGVSKVKPGDHVVLSWIKGTGADVPSTAYASKKGEVQSGAISTFMRRAVISENRLIPISKEVPLAEAALLGCAVPTGAGMVFHTAALKPGMSVAVFGAGGVGLSAVLAASACEASPIIVVDTNEFKLDLARQVGATHLVNSSKADPARSILDATGGRGVDCAIESAGNRSAMEAAFESARFMGGLCILAGNLPHGEKISIDPFHLIKGKRLVGSWAGETQPDQDIPHYANLYSKGKFPIEKLITHTYSFEKIGEALGDLERGLLGRGLIKMQLNGASV